MAAPALDTRYCANVADPHNPSNKSFDSRWDAAWESMDDASTRYNPRNLRPDEDPQLSQRIINHTHAKVHDVAEKAQIKQWVSDSPLRIAIESGLELDYRQYPVQFCLWKGPDADGELLQGLDGWHAHPSRPGLLCNIDWELAKAMPAIYLIAAYRADCPVGRYNGIARGRDNLCERMVDHHNKGAATRVANRNNTTMNLYNPGNWADDVAVFAAKVMDIPQHVATKCTGTRMQQAKEKGGAVLEEYLEVCGWVAGDEEVCVEINAFSRALLTPGTHLGLHPSHLVLRTGRGKGADFGVHHHPYDVCL